jgi:hypothetical protein
MKLLEKNSKEKQKNTLKPSKVCQSIKGALFFVDVQYT